MRTSLFLPILIALACAPCRAQTSEPGKADAARQAQGGKSDDILSPSTLPKERQNVKEQPGTARINALSPDEERRLERARARGAAKDAPHPAAETHAAAPPPAPKAEPKIETKTETKPPPARAAVAAPPPTRRAAPARRQAERAVRRDQHVGRAARPNLDTADVGERRARPSRRAADDSRERGPRVGDVIPPGVALYPLPPRAYGPPETAMRGPVPFPRASGDEPDDDDGPPSRRFMTPY